ncbi:Oidioi.mRNA.OKI2018_I69.XSR.g15282.t1.cds [Oikopleura dioica]|uniref:Oidioi.mRNA.OKI2018_I69.XSR.g15282.t1.cds n=1 Tax=Oikopleura dioica TaxID=34765 RepID=A0ABN7SGF8_OIKDI|nr:Oidioi.mRNA.OKI2018_I69.XSR.g15282.t1.cds [Oikopleura dioica]
MLTRKRLMRLNFEKDVFGELTDGEDCRVHNGEKKGSLKQIDDMLSQAVNELVIEQLSRPSSRASPRLSNESGEYSMTRTTRRIRSSSASSPRSPRFSSPARAEPINRNEQPWSTQSNKYDYARITLISSHFIVANAEDWSQTMLTLANEVSS